MTRRARLQSLDRPGQRLLAQLVETLLADTQSCAGFADTASASERFQDHFQSCFATGFFNSSNFIKYKIVFTLVKFSS